MEGRRKKLHFSLCFRCLNRLEAFYDRQKKLKKEMKHHFSDLKKRREVKFSVHAKSKDLMIKNNLNENDIKKILFSGHPIEHQSLPYRNECKIIFKGGNFEKIPLHIVVLFNEYDNVPTIVTIYNPKKQAWWKWNNSYTKRIYLNEFRTCCVHPYDSENAFDKKHHNMPHHPLYTWKNRIKRNKDKD